MKKGKWKVKYKGLKSPRLRYIAEFIMSSYALDINPLPALRRKGYPCCWQGYDNGSGLGMAQSPLATGVCVAMVGDSPPTILFQPSELEEAISQRKIALAEGDSPRAARWAARVQELEQLLEQEKGGGK